MAGLRKSSAPCQRAGPKELFRLGRSYPDLSHAGTWMLVTCPADVINEPLMFATVSPTTYWMSAVGRECCGSTALKNDPLNVLSGLGPLDALSAVGLEGSTKATDLFQDEAKRLARQHEVFLEAAGRPRWLRDLEEEERRLKDLTKGFIASDLAAQAGLSPDLASMTGVFGTHKGIDATAFAGVSAHAQGAHAFQEEAQRILRKNQNLVSSLGEGQWRQAFEDQRKSVQDFVSGIGANDATAGFDASGLFKSTSAYDSIMASMADSLVGFTRPSAMLDVLGSQFASKGFSAFRDQVAAYIHAPRPDLGGIDLIKGLVEHFNVGKSSGYADLMADALSGMDTASFDAAALDFGARLYARAPEIKEAKTAEDLRAVVGGVDASALLAQMVKLTAAIEKQTKVTEQSNATKGHRNRVPTPLEVVMLIVALMNLFVDALKKEASAPISGTSSPASIAAPRAKQHVATRPALIAKSRIPVRVGPHTTQRTLLFVNEGDILRVLDTKAGWARIVYVAPESQGVRITGWVQVKYTLPMDEETLRMLVCELLDSESIGLDCPD